MGTNNHTDARALAKARGEMFYQTGVPCVRGHVAERRAINGRCVECQREAERSAAGKARDRAKYERNAAAVKLRARQWGRANPEKRRAMAVASEHNARARRFGAPGEITWRDVLDLHRAAEGHCAICSGDDRLGLDHVEPLSKGGPNTRANLQILCVHCNSQKHARPVDVFLAERERRAA